jgi:murein DD-endopeptidase MepM/ murein hydrolase activator NlpD
MDSQVSRTRRQIIGSALGVVGVAGLAELAGWVDPAAVLGLGNDVVATPGRATQPAVRIVSEDHLAFPVDIEGGLYVLNNFNGRSVSNGPCNHKGIDIGVPTFEIGRRLLACTAGTIVDIQPTPSASQGNSVLLQDAFGDVYRYHHLDAFVEGMLVGDLVGRGELVGFMGTSGNANWPHLHFEVRRGGKTGQAVDPVPLLPFPIAGVSLGAPTGCS